MLGRAVRPGVHLIGLLLLLGSCGGSTPQERVENGLLRAYGDPPWRRMRLADRMAHYRVPGVSLAVIDDGRIAWAKAYGTRAAGGDAPVSPDTLFQAASIGKVVVAVAALRHVGRGALDLDGDVNARLTSWRVPENGFTAAAPVTLRRLLSHSAGVTGSGFRGYAAGEDVPSLRQVLDGLPPANSPPVRVDLVPGTRQRYSGGGYLIVQQLLEDVTGRPFPGLMQEEVLTPCGMAASTFAAPLPPERAAAAATGHRADGAPLPGGWHTYPEMGAGASLWTTAPDLARFAIAVMRARAGHADGVLPQALAAAMLTPQIGDRGLGPVLGDDGGDRSYFMHPGANEGFRSLLVAYPERGQGLVILTNGDGGEELCREILRSASVAYGWVPDRTPWYAGGALVLVLAIGLLVVVRRRRRRARQG